MKALIFCAGLGQRLRPITNNIPKPMVEVAGKPVLEHLVEHLNKYGIYEIIVNLHYKPEKIMKYFGTRLLYFYEPKLLGEKETEKRLVNWLGRRYIIMNGDTLTDLNLTLLLKDPFSIMSYDKVWTGCGLRDVMDPEPVNVNFGCHWVDIGTPKGLKKAREYYERKT